MPGTETERELIGTVRITRHRVYPIDPWTSEGDIRTEVVVPPGDYPAYRHGMSRYWGLTGVVNHQTVRLGDGAMGLSSGDVPSEDEVSFYSKRYGPDEWADLLDYHARLPHSPLVFVITEPAGRDDG